MSLDATQYPYRTVVFITDYIGGVEYQASGVLLSPDEVLTASHVVYNPGFGAATGITVTPAFDRSLTPYGSSSVAYDHYFQVGNPDNTISLGDSQTDYAILHLSRPFNVGTMGYAADFAGGSVHVSGYPDFAGGQQVDQVEAVTKDPYLSLLVGAPLGPGSSGGPVWVDENGSPYVVGTVSSGDSGIGYFTQITTPVFNQIQAWIAQDDYANPLIDVPFYTARNLDVAGAPINPAYHYAAYGWHEGRDPNAYFSTSGYLAFNSDVARGGVNPLDQYEQYGWTEGRDPGANFDTTLYLLYNPDVATAGIDPLQHYLQYGQAEGRMNFAAIGPAATIVQGFDAEFYLLANEDVARSGMNPLAHFEQYGWREGRMPDAVFDPGYYLAHNPDVRAAMVDPLLHYDAYGWREGRDPSAGFSTMGYLSRAADVGAAQIDPLEHYLQYGIYEGRQTT